MTPNASSGGQPFDQLFSLGNWVLFAVAVGLIGLGYALLSRPPVDGVLSLTIAPILLVAGYCIMVPAAILYRTSCGRERPAD